MPKQYVIVKDALDFDDGGFRPGATLYKEELDRMLALYTITQGTIVASGKKKYEVVLQKYENINCYRLALEAIE